MSTDRLITLLTEIRDQQRRQLENFDAALKAQTELVKIQEKGRATFQFMVFAPWGAVLLLIVYQVGTSLLR